MPHRQEAVIPTQVVHDLKVALSLFRDRSFQREEDKDAIQEACLAWTVAVKDAAPNGTPPDWRAWLIRVTRNKRADLLRKRFRLPTVPLNEVLDTELEPVARADDAVEKQTLLDRVRRAADHLGNGLNAQAFRLKHIEGWKTRQIATALGLTPDQVRERVRRTLPEFCRLLGVPNSPPG